MISGTQRQSTKTVRGFRGVLPDLTFLALLGVFWIVCVAPIVIDEQRRGFDVFRDVAYAVNIQHGQWLSDPAYPGQTIWYPPLGPAVMAGLAGLFDVTPTDCYRWSQLLFNWTLPLGLFLIVRLGWSRRSAMAATIAFLLAVPWWQSEVAHGQPSIHSVTWGWVALLLYGLQRNRGSMGWAIGCGCFVGLAFWHHPFIPATLIAVFALETAWACGTGFPAGHNGGFNKAPMARTACLLAVALVVAAPILYMMLHGPVLNREPREYIASELGTFEFALMRGNLWIWATGLIGLICSIRRADLGSRLLILALAVSVVGQLPGYGRLFELGLPSFIPTLVPHEFQRMFQLGWAICVGVGIDAGLTALTARFNLLRVRPIAVSALTLLALVATGVWGLPGAPKNLGRFLIAEPLPPAFVTTIGWIKDNTDINDVFACEPGWSFAWLNAETGRKVWISARGHSNPRVDWLARQEVLIELLETSSPETFWRLARARGIDYFIPSPSWNPKVLADPELFAQSVPRYFTLVLPGGPEAVPVFQVNPTPRR